MRAWLGLNAFTRRLILAGLAMLVLAQIGQPYPNVAPLHHIPTALLLISAPYLLAKFPLSNGAVLSVMAFLALHTLGGRYTYTNLPYDAWFEALSGQSLSGIFGWERNHYDRLVHFSFGLLFVLPVGEVLREHVQVRSRLALYFAVEFVMGISGIYEVVEWSLSVLLAPDNVEAYNGQQGDVWDAQKDMALALGGALVAALVIACRTRLAARATR